MKRLCFTVPLLLVLSAASLGGVTGGPYPAPTAPVSEPNLYLLLQLAGERAQIRYTPGFLDRAVNLQTRLELVARSLRSWTKTDVELTAYVLSREEWERAGFEIPFGIPLRIGSNGVAAPAEGDEETVRLWAELLQGVLPSVQGLPLRGTPQQAATMLLADVLVQLQVADAVIERAELGGDQPWVRGVVAQLASLALTRRIEGGRLRDLEAMYAALGRRHAPGELSARDYRSDLHLEEWLWFQAQFFRGALTIFAEEGKGSVKAMRKLRRKDDGVLRAERLLRRYEGLEAWYYETFSAVSLRPGS